MLDLQDLDLQLDQVAHKRASLPEHQALKELTAEKSVVDRELVTADTEVSDLQREQKKADSDVEQVRQRKARNQQRIDSGQITSPRDLENLQHEIGSLDRRISDLEDAELEVMEKLEAAEAIQADLRTRAEAFAGRHAELESTRDAAIKELDEQRAELGDKRATVAAELVSRAAEILQLTREALSNVGRHAQATTCRVSLHRRDGNGILEIDDDGRGFDLSGARGAGQGLTNLEARALALGGTLVIRSVPGEGTTLRVTFPL